MERISPLKCTIFLSEQENSVLQWVLKFNNALHTEETWHLRNHTVKLASIVDLQQGIRVQLRTDSRCTDSSIKGVNVFTSGASVSLHENQSSTVHFVMHDTNITE